jgi:hypothetical protein
VLGKNTKHASNYIGLSVRDTQNYIGLSVRDTQNYKQTNGDSYEFLLIKTPSLSLSVSLPGEYPRLSSVE